MRQEAFIMLYRAIEKYTPGRECFAAYYKVVIRNHLVNLALREKAIRRGGNCVFVPLEELELDRISEISRSYDTVGYIPQEQARTPEAVLITRDAANGFFTQLSEFEQKVFAQYLYGENREEIAETLGVTTAKVKNALDRCRKKFKEQFSNS